MSLIVYCSILFVVLPYWNRDLCAICSSQTASYFFMPFAIHEICDNNRFSKHHSRFAIRNKPIDTNWIVKELARREKTNWPLSMSWFWNTKLGTKLFLAHTYFSSQMRNAHLGGTMPFLVENSLASESIWLELLQYRMIEMCNLDLLLSFFFFTGLIYISIVKFVECTKTCLLHVECNPVKLV